MQMQSGDKIMRLAGAAFAMALLITAACSWGAEGDLDPSFGTGGQVGTPVGTASSLALGVVIQPDGKAVAAGDALQYGQNDIALVRYNFDGSLDASFGVGGIVTASLSPASDQVASVARQADGKLVVGGLSQILTSPNSDYDPMLARFNPDGSPDTSFGTNGGVITPIQNSDIDRFNAVLALPDQTLLGAGSANGNSAANEDSLLIRYNDDGSLDTAFGNQGIVITAVANGDSDGFLSAARQTDGKVVAGGWANQGNRSDLALVRYNDDGSLDTTFGTGGITLTTFGDLVFAEINGVAILPGGSIACAGRIIDTANSAHANIIVARYDSNGVLDNSFGTGGLVVTDVGGDVFVGGLVARVNGRLVVGATRFTLGFLNAPTRSEMLIVQYNPDGSLDAGFGTGGMTTASLFPGDSRSQVGGIALMQDGRIVAAGSAAPTLNGTSEFAAARFSRGICPDAPLDGCRSPGNSLLLLKNKAADTADTLVWRWLNGESTALADFGAPTATTNYALCVYAGSSAAEVAMPAGPKWHLAGRRRFKFKDPSRTPDGVQASLLKSGATGHARVWVKAKGENVPDSLMPPLPLPVTAQVVNDANLCFEAVYGAPDMIRNDARQFRAKTQ